MFSINICREKRIKQNFIFLDEKYHKNHRISSENGFYAHIKWSQNATLNPSQCSSGVITSTRSRIRINKMNINDQMYCVLCIVTTSFDA